MAHFIKLVLHIIYTYSFPKVGNFYTSPATIVKGSFYRPAVINHATANKYILYY